MSSQQNHGIELKARELQLQLWKRLNEKYPDRDLDPFEVTNLDHYLTVLELELEEYPEIHDQFSVRGRDSELSGQIDMGRKQVAISTKFDEAVQRFTLGHELGHFVLHQHLPDMVLHRDKPLPISSQKRPVREEKEQEADYFSACLLMPRKLLQKAFRARFGEEPFIFDENTGFWLGQDDSYSLYRPSNELERELVLATATQYKGQHFDSLCTLFNVTPYAMAIRLEELELVRKYP